MAFTSVQTKAWTYVLGGPTSTTVDYKSRPPTGAEGNWVLGIHAHVYQGSREDPMDWSSGALMGEVPIHVTMLRSSITTLTIGRDQIRWNNVVYAIKGVDMSDDVVMELFCAR